MVLDMRRGVSNAAFIEDIVKLKFAIEQIELQMTDLRKFDELPDSVAKKNVEKGLEQAIKNLQEIAKLSSDYNKI